MRVLIGVPSGLSLASSDVRVILELDALVLALAIAIDNRIVFAELVVWLRKHLVLDEDQVLLGIHTVAQDVRGGYFVNSVVHWDTNGTRSRLELRVIFSRKFDFFGRVVNNRTATNEMVLFFIIPIGNLAVSERVVFAVLHFAEAVIVVALGGEAEEIQPLSYLLLAQELLIIVLMGYLLLTLRRLEY